MKILHPEVTKPDPYWQHEVRLKHLFTTSQTAKAVRQSMNAIADKLEASPLFDELPVLFRFRGQDDLEAANALLDELYDFCDERRIWVS
ncbi:MAG: hypothetical protein KDK99_14365 [Verrucomicrobiales bacterium]|nr:hypothetical protein [Verrucomicrobiales bacterium]